MPEFCVIFDMDGVLVDTAPFHLKAWKAFGRKYGKKVSDKFFYETFGMKNNRIFAMLFGDSIPEEENKKLSDEKEALFRRCIKGHVKPFPGVIEFFKDLKKNGIITGIGSSGPRENVDLIIKELRLNKYIKASVSGDDVTQGKPDPAIFNKVAELCGVKNRNCLVVEDATMGVEAAHRAHMAVVAVTNTNTRKALSDADYIVDSLAKMNALTALRIIQKIS